jgi:uncharacterized membrane protein YdjX (TVP38/TMEM64 family)
VVDAQVGTTRSAVLRLSALGALLVVLVTAAVVVGVPDADVLRAQVAGLGPAAPAVFVLLYAAVTLLPLPKNVITAVAGLLFGLVDGVLLVLPGAMLGALAAFGLGRWLGRDAVERFTGTRVARVDALLARRGLVAILVSRLVPVLPFTGINYAAGLTAIRLRDFVLGTAIGIVPGTVAYVALGAYGTSPTSWPFVTAVLALLVLSLGGAWFASRRRRPGSAPRDLAHRRP